MENTMQRLADQLHRSNGQLVSQRIHLTRELKRLGWMKRYVAAATLSGGNLGGQAQFSGGVNQRPQELAEGATHVQRNMLQHWVASARQLCETGLSGKLRLSLGGDLNVQVGDNSTSMQDDPKQSAPSSAAAAVASD